MTDSNLEIHEIKQINLEVFGGCNLKCTMCPQSTGREKEFLKKLPIAEYKKIIDQAIPLGLKHVALNGSGEPLLYKELEESIRYLTDRGITSLIYTNGTKLTPERFESLCQAGLTVCKVSCMGWDKESYAKWMSVDAFDRVREALKCCLKIQKEKKYHGTLLQTNHLIHDINQLEQEKEMYLTNWIHYLDVKAEIWLTHNWGGQYGNDTAKREVHFKDRPRRSCGRPLGPIIEIRAGGLGGRFGAVVPCPNVLGMDSKGVVGHTSDTPLMEVMNGEKMKSLRKAHLEGDFDSVDICRHCDQLYDVQESLVWTNIEGRTYGTSRASFLNYLDFAPKK